MFENLIQLPWLVNSLLNMIDKFFDYVCVVIRDWTPKLEAVIYMETVLINWSPKLEAQDLWWEHWVINTVTVSV